MTTTRIIVAAIPFAVPALVAIGLGTWAAWHQHRNWRLAMHREWLARRPSYRGVLREVRKHREKHGTPASFEEAAA